MNMFPHRPRLALVLCASLLALAACKKDADTPSADVSETAPVATGETETVVTPATAESFLREHFAGDGEVLYAKAERDLDGDGTPEVIAYVGGPMLCGTGGCNLVVLKRRANGTLAQMADMSVVQLPVGVLDTKTGGWSDLAVTVSGGGNPGGIMRLAFDGKSYPDNPTVAPAVPIDAIGTVLIPDAPLKPLK